MLDIERLTEPSTQHRALHKYHALPKIYWTPRQQNQTALPTLILVFPFQLPIGLTNNSPETSYVSYVAPRTRTAVLKIGENHGRIDYERLEFIAEYSYWQKSIWRFVFPSYSLPPSAQTNLSAVFSMLQQSPSSPPSEEEFQKISLGH